MKEPHRITFVCLHGSAKSLIAAEYLNRIAAERGIAIGATSAGVEPDPNIPPHVVGGLRDKGFDVSGRKPASAAAANLLGAHRVIAFGCDLGTVAPEGTSVEQWSDCPAVSDGFEPAWAYITAHVEDLLDSKNA